MPTRNVSLTEKQAKFVRRSVDEGEYRNASEVVRAGLRLLQQQEKSRKMKLKMLRRMVKQASDQIDRGDYIDVDLDNLDEFVESLSPISKKARK